MSPGFLAVLGLVVIVLVGLLIWAIVSGGGGDDEAVQALEEARADLPLDMANGKKLGSDDAPLKMVAFEDFQCPFCLRYTAEDEPMIVEEYVKTGKVQIEFRHLPIRGAESVNAATGAECAADQDKFWEYHNTLFTVQAKAGQLSDEETNVGRFSNENLLNYARDNGLDVAAFESCLNSTEAAQRVADDNREASQLGVSSTPSFLFNGRPLQGTPVDLDAWRDVLNELLGQAEATPTTTGSPEATATGSPAATATGTASR